ncbi:MAG: autotransporter domain-containing protein [Alphaproteobacteria bacterium]|nr:autotransporter domain-containing protein [Alphaproteobacteria bacterium]
MELSGTNTFSGGVVNGGTLILTGAGAAGSGDIVNNDALLFTDTLANDISGAGFIQKTGAGLAELTGANTHAGGTIVAAGALRASLDNLGTGQLSLHAGARFELVQATNAVFGVDIVSDPTSVFVQSGAGVVTYNNGLFGDFEVLSGTANVMGPIGVSGANGLRVANGATLSGTGVVVGDVTNEGLLSPGGDAIGVFGVQGDYTHVATGRLRIQFDPNGDIDLLAVTGTATIEGGVVELVSLGGADGSGLTFLQAGGGVSGAFDTLITPAGGAAGILYNAFDAEISPTIVTARPSTPSSQVALIAGAADSFLNLIADEIEEERDGGVVWGRSLFGELSRDAVGASRAFDYSTQGNVGGVRTTRKSGFVVGAALAGVRGDADLELNAGDVESEGVMAAAYADWRNQNFMVSGGVSVGAQDLDIRRRVELNGQPIDLFGATESRTSGVHLGAAAMADWGGWDVSASARVNYVSTEVDNYEEGGGAVLALDWDRFDAESLFTRIRMRAERRMLVGEGLSVTPAFSLGVVREEAIDDDRTVRASLVVSGQPIVLDLDRMSRTMGEATAGFTMHWGESFDLGAHAGYQNGDGQEGAFGAVSARIRF